MTGKTKKKRLVEKEQIAALVVLSLAVLAIFAFNLLYQPGQEHAPHNNTTLENDAQIPQNPPNTCTFSDGLATLVSARLFVGGPLILEVKHRNYVVRSDQVARIQTDRDASGNVTVKLYETSWDETSGDIGSGRNYFVIVEEPTGAPLVKGGDYEFVLYIPYSASPELEENMTGDCTVYVDYVSGG